jgi:hypothetical protein
MEERDEDDKTKKFMEATTIIFLILVMAFLFFKFLFF